VPSGPSDALGGDLAAWELDLDQRDDRKRIDPRAALDGIIFRMRSGCQRNQLPQQFPDDSSVHRTFQRWRSLGVFAQLWRDLEEGCDDLGGVDWEWQAADGMLGNARMGGR